MTANVILLTIATHPCANIINLEVSRFAEFIYFFHGFLFVVRESNDTFDTTRVFKISFIIISPLTLQT